MDCFLLLVGFHHERGNEVEWSYPIQNPFLQDKERLNTLEFLAMPDQVHNNERDFCYFVLADYFCISCYEQIASSKIKEKNHEVTRATIQKSLVLFTKNFDYTPLGLSFLRAQMQEAVHAYFEQAQQGSFSNKMVLEAFHKKISQLHTLISSPTAEIPDAKFLKSSPVLRLLARFGRTALSLLKLLLLEKKTVIYGLPVGETCDLIIALTSLIPLFYEKHDQIPFLQEGQVISAEPSSARANKLVPNVVKVAPIQYAADETEYANLKLPIRVASYCFISGNVVLNQADWLCGLPSFFIGTSNALFAQHKQVLDMDVTFDATTAHMTVHSPAVANALKLTPEDNVFMDHVINKVATEEQSDPFSEFVIVDEQSTFTPGTASTWQSKEVWVRTMFAQYFKALLANVTNSTVGTQNRADAFSGHFILDWQNTRNYQAWYSQIDVRLLHSDVTLTNLSHPGFALNHGPTTLMGKSIQSVKGGFSTITSTTTSFVSSIGNAWNNRSQANNDFGWGLEGANNDASRQTATPSSPGSAMATSSSQTSSSTPTPSTTSTQPSSSQNSASTSTPSGKSGFGGFFDSVKSRITSPFGKSSASAAQFEPVSFDSTPTVTQPAQPAQPATVSTPSKPQPAPSNEPEEDLLGF